MTTHSMIAITLQAQTSILPPINLKAAAMQDLESECKGLHTHTLADN